MVWQKFEQELNPEGMSYHVCMGDLFDTDRVSFSTIVRAANLYRMAAQDNPKTEFIILAGNHDKSRDLEFVSAFDLFSMIVAHAADNVTPLQHCTMRDGMMLVSWDPVMPAADLAKMFARAEMYFGHNDVDLRSDPFNLLPTKELAAIGVQEAYTGHVHLPDAFERDGLKVTVVGSMLPYAHGEDPTGDTYVTIDLDDIGSLDLTNKCVRIRLKPGQVFDQQIDCLQLQVERVAGDTESEELDVSLGDFNLQDVFDKTIADFSIPDTIADQLRDKWARAFTSEG
jgi:DNA repair exonuclease SbcCD nuclease subunit